MRVSEILTAIASWLENPNNEAILLSEYNDDCLNVTAAGLSEAASVLRKTAEEADVFEPEEPSKINEKSIEEIAALASEFDASGDPFLKKQASVLDEILLTIATPPNALKNAKLAEDARIEALKKKYYSAKDDIDAVNKVADIQKAIDNSGMTKTYRILEAPLNTRYCPDHAGSMLARKAESQWQCGLDGKIFDFANGYTKENGTKVPGSSVELQTPQEQSESYTIFDTRESRQNNSRS